MNEQYLGKINHEIHHFYHRLSNETNIDEIIHKPIYAYAHKTIIPKENDIDDQIVGEKWYRPNMSLVTVKPYESVYNVKVESNGLRILYSGVHYVYNSMYFMPENAYTCDDFEDYSWWTCLICIPLNGYRPRVLLRNEHACKDTINLRGGLDTETGQTGGVFTLDHGDKLSMEMSISGITYFSRDTTFMGLFMIRPLDDSIEI